MYLKSGMVILLIRKLKMLHGIGQMYQAQYSDALQRFVLLAFLEHEFCIVYPLSSSFVMTVSSWYRLILCSLLVSSLY